MCCTFGDTPEPRHTDGVYIQRAAHRRIFPDGELRFEKGGGGGGEGGRGRGNEGDSEGGIEGSNQDLFLTEGLAQCSSKQEGREEREGGGC